MIDFNGTAILGPDNAASAPLIYAAKGAFFEPRRSKLLDNLPKLALFFPHRTVAEETRRTTSSLREFFVVLTT
jgi:hypothetical protein